MTNDSTRVKPPDLGDDPDWYYDIRDDIDDSISYLSEELNHISPADASVTFWLLHLHYNAYYEKRHQDTPALLAALIGDVLETEHAFVERELEDTVYACDVCETLYRAHRHITDEWRHEDSESLYPTTPLPEDNQQNHSLDRFAD